MALGQGPPRLHWSTLGLAAIVVAAVLAQAWPEGAAALEFDRQRIAAGQWWRPVSGHLVHYGWPHMAADMGVFAALCWVAQRRGRGVAWSVAIGGVAVGAAVYWWAPDTNTYRGMSGVDSAVFGYLVVTEVVRDRGLKAAAWLTALALTLGRFVFETATGRPILPTSLPDGIAVVGIAHMAGLVAGCMAAAVSEAVRNRPLITAPMPCPVAAAETQAGSSSTV
jgi:rhomboid family GlyGly-CTERM serine protease